MAKKKRSSGTAATAQLRVGVRSQDQLAADVAIKGKLIDQGEVVTASGNFSVRITEIVASQ